MLLPLSDVTALFHRIRGKSDSIHQALVPMSPVEEAASTGSGDGSAMDMSRTESDLDDTPLSSSYTRSIHYRQTRKKSKIIKQVTEQYLRNDMGFGITYTAEGDDLSSDEEEDTNGPKRKLHSQVDQVVGKPTVIHTVEDLLARLKPKCKPYALVVVDTNVLLHNFDVLEKAVLGEKASVGVMPNIVIPQTALLECKSNRLTAYDRTVDLLRSVTRHLPDSSNAVKSEDIQRHCPIFFPDQNHAGTAMPSKKVISLVGSTAKKTPNDENDRRIRRVAHFLAKHVQGTKLRVVLLTDDKECRARAKQESGSIYQAYSVADWVKVLERENPQMSSLSDLVANFNCTSDALQTDSDVVFSPHVEASELSLGIQQGKYHRGCFRVVTESGTGERSGSVTIRQGEERVAVTIRNGQDSNRAIDGDIIAMTINPVEEWISAAGSESTARIKKTVEETGIANDTADTTPADLENVDDTITVGKDRDVSVLRPTGKIVGIVRRNFASYSGSVFETAAFGKEAEEEKVVSDLAEREEIAAKFEREHSDGSFTCVFFAVDRKVPPILIRTTQRDRLLGQRIIVAMDSWPTNSPFPFGHYVRTIGPAGSKDVETQVLLQEHNIPHEPFPAAVLACLPPDDYKIGADMGENSKRLDLRHLPVLSIDPPGCKGKCINRAPESNSPWSNVLSNNHATSLFFRY